MEKEILNQQSQHWEKNFSIKPEMFGLQPSIAAKKSLILFNEKKIKKIIELGAGLGRDTIFFAQNSIRIQEKISEFFRNFEEFRISQHFVNF